MKTQINMVALAAAFSIPAFGQELPITGSFETRLGKLELIDGYPTEATAKKLYDDIDFQRACQAYIWALTGSRLSRAAPRAFEHVWRKGR